MSSSDTKPVTVGQWHHQQVRASSFYQQNVIDTGLHEPSPKRPRSWGSQVDYVHLVKQFINYENWAIVVDELLVRSVHKLNIFAHISVRGRNKESRYFRLKQCVECLKESYSEQEKVSEDHAWVICDELRGIYPVRVGSYAPTSV